MASDRVGEGSTFALSVTFLDALSVQAVPTSIHYRIDCATNAQTVRDWTEVSPATTVAIPVSASDNAIIEDGNRKEAKELRVVVDRGLPTQFVHPLPYKWTVYNIAPSRRVTP
jgi:hypothetical protein